MKNSLKILIMAMSLWTVDIHGSREPWDISNETLDQWIDEAITEHDGYRLAGLDYYTQVRSDADNEIFAVDDENSSKICILNAYIDCFVFLKAVLLSASPNGSGLSACFRQFYFEIFPPLGVLFNSEKEKPNWYQILNELPLIRDGWYLYPEKITNEEASAISDICNELAMDINARLKAVNDPENELKMLRIIFERLKDLNFDIK